MSIAEEAANRCACALACRVGELAEIHEATPFSSIDFEKRRAFLPSNLILNNLNHYLTFFNMVMQFGSPLMQFAGYPSGFLHLHSLAAKIQASQ